MLRSISKQSGESVVGRICRKGNALITVLKSGNASECAYACSRCRRGRSGGCRSDRSACPPCRSCSGTGLRATNTTRRRRCRASDSRTAARRRCRRPSARTRDADTPARRPYLPCTRATIKQVIYSMLERA